MTATDTAPRTITATQSRAIAAALFDLYPVLTPDHTRTYLRDRMGRTLLLSELSEAQAGDILLILENKRRPARPAPAEVLAAEVKRMRWGNTVLSVTARRARWPRKDTPDDRA